MSDSGYKIKSHRRFRTSKPYEKPTGLVGRVREWLSPSSWASYFNTTYGNDSNQLTDQPKSTNQVIARSHPFFYLVTQHPQKSEALSSKSVLVSKESCTEHSRTNSDNFRPTGPSRKLFTKNTSFGTKSPSFVPITSPLAMYQTRASPYSHEKPSRETPDSADTSVDPLEQKNTSNDSEGSWIAEADVEVLDTSWIAEDDTELTSGDPFVDRKVSRSMQISLSKEEETSKGVLNSPYSYVLGEGKVGVVQSSTFLVTPGAEVPVCRVANPVYSNGPHTVTFSKDVNTTVFNANNSNRPSTVAKLAATPQLSHVQEMRDVVQPIRSPRTFSLSETSSKLTAASFAERSQGQARVSRPSFSVAPFLTPSSVDTSESIKRSPFHSPFYSGRTSYGGAASGQRLRFKRPRTESTLPSNVPLQVTVRPSNTLHATPTLMSETAKRILSSLQSSNSPLTDARKMPMRHMPREDQPAKRHRQSDITSPGSVISPPPVTPLHTSSHTPHRPHPSSGEPPHPKVTSSPLKSVPESITSLNSTHETSSTGTVPRFSTPLFNLGSTGASTSKQSTILSNLKFTPAPVTHKVGKSASRSPSRDDEQEESLSFNVTRQGSRRKIRARRSQHHFSRKALEEEEEEETFFNPLAPPPPVGLNLGKGKSLSGLIKFHTQLSPNSTATTTTSAASSLSQNFSFSVPKPITNITSPSEGLRQVSAAFGFTTPTPHSLVVSSGPMSIASMVGTRPSELGTSTSITDAFRGPPMLVKPRLKEPSVPKPSLPLKSASVEDVFKTLLKPSGIASGTVKPSTKVKEPSPSSSQDVSVINLTGEEEKAGEKQPALLNLQSQFGPDSSKCMACQAPKLSSVSSKPLVAPPNTTKLSGVSSESSPSISSISAQFAPPPGSWECDKCMVFNKADVDACVACTMPRPKTTSPSLVDKFAPPPGSWECDTCMLSNKSGDDKCIACSTPKPNSKTSAAFPNTGSTLGGEGGFKLNANMPMPGLSLQPLPQFARPVDAWSCDTCLLNNDPKSLVCIACSAPKPGTKAGAGSGLNAGTNLGTKGGLESGGLKVSGGLLLGGSGVELGASMVATSGHESRDSGGTGIKLGETGIGSGGLKLGGVSLGGTGIKLGETGMGSVGLKLGGGVSLGGTGIKLAETGTGSGRLKLGGGVSLGGTGIKLGETGTGSGGLKLGGGVSLGGTGIKLAETDTGSGRLKLGGGVSLGGTGIKFGSLGGTGIKLGETDTGSGGLKLGDGVSLGGTGIKLGETGTGSGELKLGGGVSLGGTGIKLGETDTGSGGLKLGDGVSTGIKLGETGMGSRGLKLSGGVSLGGTGIKLGETDTGSGGLKLGGGVSLGGTGIKLGETGTGISIGSGGGLNLGTSQGLIVDGDVSLSGSGFKASVQTSTNPTGELNKGTECENGAGIGIKFGNSNTSGITLQGLGQSKTGERSTSSSASLSLGQIPGTNFLGGSGLSIVGDSGGGPIGNLLASSNSGGPQLFMFTGNKPNLSQLPSAATTLSSSAGVNLTGTNLKLGESTPLTFSSSPLAITTASNLSVDKTNLNQTSLQFAFGNPTSSTISGAPGSSSLGGIFSGGNQLANTKVGEGFNFMAQQPSTKLQNIQFQSPFMFGTSSATTQSASLFKFSGGNKSSVTTSSGSSMPATVNFDFGGSVGRSSGNLSFMEQKGTTQQSSTPLVFHASSKQAPSNLSSTTTGGQTISFGTSQGQAFGRSISMDTAMESNQQMSGMSPVFQFGQSLATTTMSSTQGSNQGHIFPVEKNFNFLQSGTMLSSESGSRANDVNKRIIKKATRRKK